MDKIKQQIKNALFKVEDSSEHKNTEQLVEFFTAFENYDFLQYEKDLEEYLLDLDHLERIVLQCADYNAIKEFLILKRLVTNMYNLKPDYNTLINCYEKSAKDESVYFYLDRMFTLYYHKFKTIEEMQDLIFNIQINPLTEKLYGGIVFWINKLVSCKGANFTKCEDALIKRMQVLNETVKNAKETDTFNTNLVMSMQFSQNNCVNFAIQNENANLEKLKNVITPSEYKRVLKIKQERLNEK